MEFADNTLAGRAARGAYTRKPAWLRVQLQAGAAFGEVRKTLDSSRLHTVCEEARCPNLHECWGKYKTASFMILGDTCTRRCRFCAVKTGLPRGVDGRHGQAGLDHDEPRRVAEAALAMNLVHVVVTMVTRDDLPDGGAGMMAATVAALRLAVPSISVELLSSDLMGNRDSIRSLAASGADILSHNLETVRRLTPIVRSRSDYDRSLAFLVTCREFAPRALIKSSLMLGLGETREEILATMDDLRAAGIEILNLGQYLQPSRLHAPVEKYWTPEEFAELRQQGIQRGFRHVEAGPLVRSSYHAGEQFAKMTNMTNIG